MRDTHFSLLSGPFKAPEAGYYTVAGIMNRGYPTGVYETVPNPNRKLWQFWKPAFITREIWHFETIMDGRVVRYLKKDEVAEGPWTRL